MDNELFLLALLNETEERVWCANRDRGGEDCMKRITVAVKNNSSMTEMGFNILGYLYAKKKY